MFVTFLTAGYPTPDVTVDALLALEAGGADIIELGVPFSDPMADGAVIQKANNIAIEHGIGYTQCLEYVKEARKRGLKAPIIFMGELCGSWRKADYQVTTTRSLPTVRRGPSARPGRLAPTVTSSLTCRLRRHSSSAMYARTPA